MAMQRAKSVLVSKLGERGRKAYEAAKSKEIDYGNPSLPAGIEGGIAQLSVSGTGFGEFKEGPNKGKLYFMASGIVHEPREVNGVPIAGLRTQIGPIPLCDTPQSMSKKKTFEDHLEDVVNEIRKLLGPDAEAPEFDELESTVESLKEVQPFFRFRTWKGAKATSGPYKDKEPRVVHQWNGVCDYTGGDLGPAAGAEDSSGEGDAGANGDVQTPTHNGPTQRSTQRAVPVIGTKPRVTTPVEDAKGDDAGDTAEAKESETFNEFGDLDSLLKQAEEGDEGACDTLTDMAIKAGLSEDVIQRATWQEVVKLITDASLGTTDEEAPTEENSGPKVGEVYLYKPINPKTKVREKKATECEVLEVNRENSTVALRSLEDAKRVYRGVPFDLLDK